jgi:hypothetical protein
MGLVSRCDRYDRGVTRSERERPGGFFFLVAQLIARRFGGGSDTPRCVESSRIKELRGVIAFPTAVSGMIR